MPGIRKATNEIRELSQLVIAIEIANTYFLTQIQKQVNTALTLRNWIIGRHIVEYEQKGEDRSQYGQQLFKEIGYNLKQKGLKSISERYLYVKIFTLFIPKFCRRCLQNYI